MITGLPEGGNILNSRFFGAFDHKMWDMREGFSELVKKLRKTAKNR